MHKRQNKQPTATSARPSAAGRLLHRRTASTPATEIASPVVSEVLRSPGQPLDAATRAYFEPRFGHDFSKVRVHTDIRAAESAKAVQALAYTVGQDIVFNCGHYQPRFPSGRELLAHELAHVVQSPWSRADGKIEIGAVNHPAERQANEVAHDALGVSRPVHLRSSNQEPTSLPVLRRTPDVTSPQGKSKLKYRYRRSNVEPSTGIGHFDEVEYNSERQVLTITVRPEFHFPTFNIGDYPREIRNDLEAQQKAKLGYELKKQAFIASFVRQAEGWGGHHVFFCQEPGLETLHASVRVEVDLARNGPTMHNESHTPVTVAPETEAAYLRGDHAAFQGKSMQTQWGSGYGMHHEPEQNIMVPHDIGPPFDLGRRTGERGWRPGELPGLSDTRVGLMDNEPTTPAEEVVLMHELGHIFGLGDEYHVEDKPPTNKLRPDYLRGRPTEHSALAKAMLNKTVVHDEMINKGSIMAKVGNEIRPEHGVTFLDALQTVTGLRWGFQPVSKRER